MQRVELFSIPHLNGGGFNTQDAEEKKKKKPTGQKLRALFNLDCTITLVNADAVDTIKSFDLRGRPRTSNQQLH